jgi:hypothetical protein
VRHGELLELLLPEIHRAPHPAGSNMHKDRYGGFHPDGAFLFCHLRITSSAYGGVDIVDARRVECSFNELRVPQVDSLPHGHGHVYLHAIDRGRSGQKRVTKQPEQSSKDPRSLKDRGF